MRTQFTAIAIASAPAAHIHAPAWRPDAVVAIASPSRPAAPQGGGDPEPVARLALRFHDLEAAAHRHRRGPELAHLDAFLAFMAEQAPRRLLIFCRAGLSRSPAFAAVALVAGGHADPLEALATAAPGVQPNRRILALAEQRCGVDLVQRAEGLFSYRRSAWGAAGPALPGLVEIAGPPGGSDA